MRELKRCGLKGWLGKDGEWSRREEPGPCRKGLGRGRVHFSVWLKALLGRNSPSEGVSRMSAELPKGLGRSSATDRWGRQVGKRHPSFLF